MARRKYSFEFRLEVVRHYLNSPEGYRLTGDRFNVPRTQVRMWVAAYTFHGEEGVRPKRKGVSADPDLRMAAVKEVLEAGKSYNDVAIQFNLSGAAVIAKWLKVYTQYGEEGLRSLRVGKNRELHMADDPIRKAAAQERSKDRQIKELERKVKYLETRVIYLKKLKALVR